MKKTLLAACLAASSLMALPAAHAAYPDQPIKIVIGYAAGGTTDILARALAEQLGKILNDSIIVENKPGAAGNIAATYVQQASPDGYTLFMATVASHGISDRPAGSSRVACRQARTMVSWTTSSACCRSPAVSRTT